MIGCPVSPALLQDLLLAADELIADMRLRAQIRGDYFIEDHFIPGAFGATAKRKICTLDCGSGVLNRLDDAREAARKHLDDYYHQHSIKKEIPRA